MNTIMLYMIMKGALIDKIVLSKWLWKKYLWKISNICT